MLPSAVIPFPTANPPVFAGKPRRVQPWEAVLASAFCVSPGVIVPATQWVQDHWPDTQVSQPKAIPLNISTLPRHTPTSTFPTNTTISYSSAPASMTEKSDQAQYCGQIGEYTGLWGLPSTYSGPFTNVDINSPSDPLFHKHLYQPNINACLPIEETAEWLTGSVKITDNAGQENTYEYKVRLIRNSNADDPAVPTPPAMIDTFKQAEIQAGVNDPLPLNALLNAYVQQSLGAMLENPTPVAPFSAQGSAQQSVLMNAYSSQQSPAPFDWQIESIQKVE